MTLSFLEAESSIEDSAPDECYEIAYGASIYRLSSSAEDVSIGVDSYPAGPVARGEAGVSSSTNPRELTMIIPVSHPFVARYHANGTPPRLITMKVWRYQPAAGLAECVWRGKITSMRCERHLANLRVVCTSGMAVARRLPVWTAGPECANILYDENCKVSRDLFNIYTSVVTFGGRVVTVATMGGKPDNWARFGEALHVPSGERMTIQSQIGSIITMQAPIWEMQTLDAIQIFAGCPHEIATCRDKFANQPNYVGQPELPIANPMIPNGFGVFQSE